jgi:hypothetical protein
MEAFWEVISHEVVFMIASTSQKYLIDFQKITK